MEQLTSQPLSFKDFKVARVSATAKAPEIELVYLENRNWCGSGGCTLWIIKKQNNRYTFLRRVTIVKLPIRLLGRSADGYPIFGVWVQGGGIIRGYEAALARKDGMYPGSPSEPAVPKGTKGVTLISRHN
jgi:hypothetical protein